MRAILLIAALILGIGIVVGVTGEESPSATHPPQEGRIVFSRLDPHSGTVRLYSVRPDGSGVRAVTSSSETEDSQADWSPDGSKIAFRRFLVVNRDGTQERNLSRASCTGECLASEEPAWSPDGRQIAFMRAFGPVSDEGNAATIALFVMDADGANVRQLSQLEPNSGTGADRPGWISPPGVTTQRRPAQMLSPIRFRP